MNRAKVLVVEDDNFTRSTLVAAIRTQGIEVVGSASNARDALAIAQRIREQTECVRLRHLPDLRITSSIGVAPADHRHSNLRAWIDAADAALYVAKHEGRNRVSGYMEPALAPAV